MKTDRGHFLSAAVAGTLASSARGAETVNNRYRKLDRILQSPVLKKQLFKTPVVIDSVELLRLNNSYVCRVRSKDGAEGISLAHTGMSTFFPISLKNVQPFLVGKDARELDLMRSACTFWGPRHRAAYAPEEQRRTNGYLRQCKTGGSRSRECGAPWTSCSKLHHRQNGPQSRFIVQSGSENRKQCLLCCRHPKGRRVRCCAVNAE